MNELMTLGLLAAGAYLVSKQAGQTTETPAARTLTTEEVQQNTPVATKIQELQASGQLVTGVQEVTTSKGQTATVIVAPTPDVPNRGVVADPADLARLQGYYVPKVTMTPAIQEQMAYHGYPNFDEFIRRVAANQIFFYGPSAWAIKFPLTDWEFWRTNGQFQPVTNLSKAVPWDTLLTQEEYNALRDQHGLSGLRGLGCDCAGHVWLT